MTSIPSGKQLLNMEDILVKQVGLTSGMKVADLGSGNGFNTLAAAKIVGGKGQVYAVDVLKTALATVDTEARHHNLTNIKTVWSNIEILGATKIPENSLDVEIIVHTLFQVNNIDDFMQEALRLLKPSGTIAIIDWQKKQTQIGPPLENRVSEEEVKQRLANISGLKEVGSFMPGQYHYGLLYKKLEG